MVEIPDEAAELLERARADELGEEEEPPASSSNGHGAAPGSLIAGLRAQQRQIAKGRTTIIEFPRGLWAGKLAARYQLLDERALNRLRRVTQTADADELLDANADVLISACLEVLARRDTSEPWGPIIEGERLRFDRQLGEALELDADTARQVLYALCGGRIEGAGVVNSLSADYVSWWQGATPEVVDELAGESRPTS
jgi:hypothetical protein